jgi:hypothetical protein
VQAAVVVNQNGVQSRHLVYRTAEAEERPLFILVLLHVEPHQTNVLSAKEHDLALVKRVAVVPRPVVHVSLGDVVQLVHICVQDCVALLHGRVALDAELLDEGLHEVVFAHVQVSGENGDVTGHAVGAKHLKVKRSIRGYICRLVFAELGQVQEGLLGGDGLVTTVELVKNQVLQHGCAGQKAKVHIAQLQFEVTELWRQVHGLVIEGAGAPNASVWIQNGGTQVLRNALLRLEDGSKQVALVKQSLEGSSSTCCW